MENLQNISRQPERVILGEEPIVLRITCDGRENRLEISAQDEEMLRLIAEYEGFDRYANYLSQLTREKGFSPNMVKTAIADFWQKHPGENFHKCSHCQHLIKDAKGPEGLIEGSHGLTGNISDGDCARCYNEHSKPEMDKINARIEQMKQAKH